MKSVVSITVLSLVLGIVGLHCSGADESPRGPRMGDAELFAALNLGDERLAGVRGAVENKDWPAARRALADCIRRRKRPVWFFDWKAKPAPSRRPKKRNVTKADRYARNELVSVGIWHDFGTDIDWRANPTPDRYREWTWQLNRHSFWEALGRAYWDTGDEKYARAFVRQMRDWVTDNPVPLGGPANQAGSPWRTLEAGIRMVGSWLNAFHYFLSSRELGDDDVVTLVKSFVEHARYLVKFPTAGNWLLQEMNGLYHVGAMFPELREAETWRRTAMTRLLESLEAQVYPDGAHYELSPSYHQYAVRSFAGPLHLARINNYSVPSGYLDQWIRMFEYMLYAAMPNGCLPGINDSSYKDIRESLKEGHQFFPHRRDFLWLATDGREGSAPAKTSYAFPFAGQLIMRSGWEKDARYLMFDVGPFGFKHQHEDKLNVIIHAYGKTLVVDPGNYRYDDSKWRMYAKSSYAHNVVHVDRKDQHRRGLKGQQGDQRYVVKNPLPHVWESTEKFDYASATFGSLPEEGFGEQREKIVTHTRHVLYVKRPQDDYWVLVDVLKPNDDRPHTYEAMFHLDVKDVAIEPRTRRVLSRNDQAANLAILPVVEEGLAVEVVRGQERPVVQGWLPTKEKGFPNGLRPIPTVVFRRTVPGTAFFAYVLYPIPPGGALPVQAVVPVGRTAEALRLRVTFNDGRTDELTLGSPARVDSRP